jgi:hypothetical protein
MNVSLYVRDSLTNEFYDLCMVILREAQIPLGDQRARDEAEELHEDHWRKVLWLYLMSLKELAYSRDLHIENPFGMDDLQWNQRPWLKGTCLGSVALTGDIV